MSHSQDRNVEAEEQEEVWPVYDGVREMGVDQTRMIVRCRRFAPHEHQRARGLRNMTHVKISTTIVEEIGKYALSERPSVRPRGDLKDLDRIEFVNETEDEEPRLRVIGSYAFSNLPKLRFISPFPKSLESLGDRSFKGSILLKEVDLSACVLLLVLEDSLFLDCHALELVRLPPRLASIERRLFAYCKSLTTISIPPSVKQWGDRVFFLCTSLTCVEFLSVRHLDRFLCHGQAQLNGCPSLHTLRFPKRSVPLKLWNHCLHQILSEDGRLFRQACSSWDSKDGEFDDKNCKSIAFNFLREHISLYFEEQQRSPATKRVPPADCKPSAKNRRN